MSLYSGDQFAAAAVRLGGSAVAHMDDRSLSGKTVLLTGAGRGLGFAMAEGLAAAGANVAMLGTDADVLRDAVARVGEAVRAVHDAGRLHDHVVGVKR